MLSSRWVTVGTLGVTYNPGCVQGSGSAGHICLVLGQEKDHELLPELSQALLSQLLPRIIRLPEAEVELNRFLLYKKNG